MTTPSLKARRLFSYQNDVSGTRTIIATAGDSTGTGSLTNGVLYWDALGDATPIFTPASGAGHPRLVSSRDYAFFTDSVEADLEKWNINSSLTKWGIDAPTAPITVGTPTGGGGTPFQIFPATFLNGWGANAHVGAYELGVDQGFNFGLDSGTTVPYVSPSLAFDNDESTKASIVLQHTHTYAGCVWKFTDATPASNMQLNVLSEVPVQGGGTIITARSAGIWYSLDAGDTWVQVYNQVPRSKQWDHIPLPDGQDLNDVQVMAFTDSHDDMAHYVYEINIEGVTTGTGPITLNSGRKYYLVFNNTTTGHYSDLNPISTSTGELFGAAIPLGDLEVSSDPQVDKKTILATADGGDPTVLYFVVEIDNATTTAQDGIPEEDLVLGNTFLFTDDSGQEHGVTDNTPPPNGSFPVKHLGRIYMAEGQLLRFSKSLDELVTSTGTIVGRYEEAWPADYLLDISEGAERIRALFSDGFTLYIGTENHVRRLRGDGPLNFSQPEIVFNETGVLSPEVWKVVFLEGAPVGAMWLTPDFRVIGSDFNVYDNVGAPIQGTLNSINPSASLNAWAMFVSDGPYNLFLLAVPTGINTDPDTLCVYDMRLKKWYVWNTFDKVLSGLFYFNLMGIPRWVMADSSGVIRVFDKTEVLDRAGDETNGDQGIVCTIKTVWLNFGDPTMRKAINEIETMTNEVSRMTVSVEGASTSAEFDSALSIVNNSTLIRNIFKEYKTFLAAKAAKDRFYRITWNSTSDSTSTPTDSILDSFSVEVVPIHRA